MGKQKKSAKDIAFEKERCQYKKKIRELDQCLSKTKAETDDLRQHIASLETENATLQDWVDRLLEYTELSEEGRKCPLGVTAALSMILPYAVLIFYGGSYIIFFVMYGMGKLWWI